MCTPRYGQYLAFLSKLSIFTFEKNLNFKLIATIQSHMISGLATQVSCDKQWFRNYCNLNHILLNYYNTYKAGSTCLSTKFKKILISQGLTFTNLNEALQLGGMLGGEGQRQI